MGALGTLGIGLSVLFGLFLAVLAAEIYYMLCWRKGRLGARSNSRRRVNSVQVVEAEAAAAATEIGGFAHEAALVGSFGGYPGSPLQSEFVTKLFPPTTTEDFHISSLDGVLYTIAEETKEEMELHNGVRNADSGSGACTTVDTVLKLCSDYSSAVDTVIPSTASFSVPVSRTSASSSSASFSVTPDATPFATPPSSPTSSDTPLSSPSASPVTAVSRFSVLSSSPASASSSPATAVSHFSIYSASPTSTAVSPVTAASRLSVDSPTSVAVSPATPATARFPVNSPASTSTASHRSSMDSPYIYADRGTLGALFRRSYNSPSRYSPLRPAVWSGHITDFRHALPFSPPNAEFFMNR